MAREIDAALTTTVNLSHHQPIELIEVQFPSGTRRWSTAEYSFTWNSQTWTPIGIDRSSIHFSADRALGEITIRIDDADKSLTATIAKEQIEGCQIIVRKIYRDAIDTDACIVLFEGRLMEPTISAGVITLKVAPWYDLTGIQVPATLLWTTCRYRVYDSRCTLDADDFTESGTVASVSTADTGHQVLHDATINGADGLFTYGSIKMTLGDNNGIRRTVIAHRASESEHTLTLDHVFPYDIEDGVDTYELMRGCGRTWKACKSFNNHANFGGVPTVPLGVGLI